MGSDWIVKDRSELLTPSAWLIHRCQVCDAEIWLDEIDLENSMVRLGEVHIDDCYLCTVAISNMMRDGVIAEEISEFQHKNL